MCYYIEIPRYDTLPTGQWAPSALPSILPFLIVSNTNTLGRLQNT